MITGILEGGIALLLGVAGGIYIIGQLNNNARRNEEDIDSIKKMIGEYQEGMKKMMANNIADMRVLLDTNKEHQKENLEREIQHIKDLISITSNETREDIKRLEARQGENNHLREKLALVAASVKSLHHRLDVEPPVDFSAED